MVRASGACPNGLRYVWESQYALQLELEGGVVVRGREGEVKLSAAESRHGAAQTTRHSVDN